MAPMSDQVQLEVESRLGRQTLSVTARPDQNLAELLAEHGLALNARCGYKGLCDGCTVKLMRGRLTRLSDGSTIEAKAEAISLRACEHCLADAPAAIRIPARSLSAHKPQIVDQFQINVPYSHDPLAGGFGAAIDVGTTTVAVIVVDLSDGRIVGRASAFNGQIPFGDNVLTRISLCRTDPLGVRTLQDAVAGKTLRSLLSQAVEQAGIALDKIGCLSIAGNTTMLHLLAGVDPSPLGVVPFKPVFLDHRQLRGRDIGADWLGDVPVHLLPGAAAYIGADLCAGIVSTGMLYDQGPSVLVDIGTNGEIILKHNAHVLGCATAAGPAFEGSGLACGVRGIDGAIEHVTVSSDPFDIEVKVIGDEDKEPIGLCGTAYVDLLGQGRRCGLLTAGGRFNESTDTGERLADWDEYGRMLRVAQGASGKALGITEPDIAALLQAKAAIAAGMLTLLSQADMAPEQVQTLYLAGGFGMHLDLANTIACGILPGFEADQIRLVGNTALAGAYMGLIDRNMIDQMARVSDQMKVVELNLDPAFEDTYIDQLSLPG